VTSSRIVDSRSTRLIGLALLLAMIAYRPLVEFASQRSLEREIEVMLFSTTATGPPIVLLLAGWLLYRRWPRLRALPRQTSLGPAIALLTPCLLLYAWGTHTGDRNLFVVALMLNLLGFGLLLWGKPGLRPLSLPVGFLVFALSTPPPLLNQILWNLQIWTTEYTGFLLSSLGMSHLISGEQIIRADQNFAIIESCSGLRSVESLTMLTLLMVDLFRRHGLHAVLLTILAPVVAFGLNGFRALTLIMNPHSEIVAIHNLQGVSILLAGLVAIYLIDGALERLLGGRDGRGAGSDAIRPSPSGHQGLLIGNAVLAVLVILSVALPRWESPPRGSLPFPDSQIPKQVGEWKSSPVEMDRQFMGIVGFRAWVDRRYERRGEAIRLFAGVGGHEKRSVSPFSPKTGLPGSGWWVEASSELTLEPDGRRVRARIVRWGKGARRKLVLDWNEGTRGLLDEVARSALGLNTSFWDRPREGVALRLSTRLRDSTERVHQVAEARLRGFYSAIRPRLDQLGYPRG
jgi:EpsI family protein